ncbi:hypothetical protein AB1E18_001068 [Capra hircus]
MDGEVTPGSGGQGHGGDRRTEDRELQLRVTGNYFKSLLEAALLSQRGRLILRVALPQCLNLIPKEQRRGFTLDDKRGGERPALPGLRAPAMTVSARRHLEQVPTPRVTPQWASCLDLGILTLHHLLLQRCPLVPLSLICAGWSYTLLTRDFTLGQVCPGLGLKQIKEDAENREQLSWGKGEEERRLIQRSLRDPAPSAPAGTRGPGFGHPPAPPAKSSVIP